MRSLSITLLVPIATFFLGGCEFLQSGGPKNSQPSASSPEVDESGTLRVQVKKFKRTEASLGNTTVVVPEETVARDAVLTLRRRDVATLDESVQVILGDASEPIEVELLNPVTGRLVPHSELKGPLEFRQTIPAPADQTLVKVVYVAPAHPVDGEEQKTVVHDSKQLAFEALNLTAYLVMVKAEIMEPSFIAAMVVNSAEVTGLGQLVAKPGDEVGVLGSNLHSHLNAEIEGKTVAVIATGSSSGKFAMPDVRPGLVTVAVKEGLRTVKSIGLVSDAAGDGIPIMVNVDVTEICSDQQFRDASGAVVQGTRNCAGPAACAGDGDINCVATTEFPAADVEALDAWDLRAGETVAGVIGKLKTNCRNGVDLASFDMGSLPRDGVAYQASDQITSTAHGLSDEAPIRFGYPPSGLDSSSIYYVTVLGPNAFRVSTTTPAGPAVNITYDELVVFYAAPNGARNIWDTIDDNNDNGSILTAYPNVGVPAGSSWTSDNFCGGIEAVAGDANVWKDVSVDGPDGDTIGCSNADDDCVFEDKISGLQWSELLPGPRKWSQALSDCDLLGNSPSLFAGHDDWRLPTQKELMDAYNHGIRSAATAHWLTSAEMDSSAIWSATTMSFYQLNARIVNLGHGYADGTASINTRNVLCVR